jgi:hypothetical protein
MTTIEHKRGWDGEQKKKWVINHLKAELDLNEDIEDMIGEFIDWIIVVDKGGLSINPKIKKTLLSRLCCKKF